MGKREKNMSPNLEWGVGLLPGWGRRVAGPNPERWGPEGWGPEGWGTRRVGAPKGRGPEGWEHPRVGAPKGGGPKISRFFFPPRHNFLSFFSLGVFLWNFGGVFEAQGP